MAQHEPFYFRSFNRVVGVAHDESELFNEALRLASQDPKALEYHVMQGHITSWLKYIGRSDLAEALEASQSKGLQGFLETLRMVLAGATEKVRCPYCGFEAPYVRFRLTRPPWAFGGYWVRALQCPSCGRRFRLYYPAKEGRSPFTVPRPGVMANA